MLWQRANKRLDSVVKKRRPISSWVLRLLTIALPIVLLVLVRYGLIELAVLLVLASKWRVFAVRPRHWLANLRSNATDLIVKLSTLIFIIQSHSLLAQAIWAGWYIIWLAIIKPRSDNASVGLQAVAGLFLGLSALSQFVDHLPEIVIIAGAWLIGVYTSRHYLTNYEEPFARLISYGWGLVVAELMWVAFRWMLVYLFVPQVAIIGLLIAYTAGGLYDLQQKERVNQKIIRQHVVLACAILLVILLFANWSGQL